MYLNDQSISAKFFSRFVHLELSSDPLAMSDDGSGSGNPTSQEQSDNIKQLVRDLLREEPSLLTPAVESAEAKATEKMPQSGSGKLCMASATWAKLGR